MNPKVTSSFAIVLVLAMLLSSSPAMIMPSNIFASPSDDGGGGSSDDGGGGSSDDGGGGSSDDGGGGSSENEQPEVESEPEVTQEEETESELVNCPDGSQAATTEECPTTGAGAAAPSELVNCPDGSQAATTEECTTGNGTSTASTPQLETPNILFGDYFYTDPCQSNPNDPLCKTPITSSTTTPGAPSGSIPADTGAEKNDICANSPETPFCKSSTTTGAPSGSIPADTGAEKNDICANSPETPFCKSSTTTGTTTGAPTSGTTTGAPTSGTTTGAPTSGKTTEPPTPTGQTGGTTSTGEPQTFLKGPDGKCPTGAVETNVGACVSPSHYPIYTCITGGTNTVNNYEGNFN